MKTITLQIEVTAADIENGSMRNARSCPIARAVNRAVSEILGQSFIDPRSTVGSTVTTTVYDGVIASHFNGPTPKTALEFWRAFDRELPVEPFSFVLELDRL